MTWERRGRPPDCPSGSGALTPAVERVQEQRYPQAGFILTSGVGMADQAPIGAADESAAVRACNEAFAKLKILEDAYRAAFGPIPAPAERLGIDLGDDPDGDNT